MLGKVDNKKLKISNQMNIANHLFYDSQFYRGEIK